MKKKLVILSAAAMVAAAAVPALAFENEFHGMYRLRSNVTNAMAAGASLSDDSDTLTYFEQRARLQYIAKASDDLKLVTHFEIDSSWGDAAYSNGRGLGAGLAGDTVNLETKNVYLDFNLPSTKVNVKAGLQGFKDAYQGIFLYDDVGGAIVSSKFDALTATAAFFRTYDQGGASTFGKKNVDVYVLDGKFALNKDVNLGASYYLAYNDSNESVTKAGDNQSTHTFGLNAAAKLGVVDLDAFVLYQTGEELYNYYPTGPEKIKDLSAWAAQVAAKANLGAVTLRGAFLYASGDDGEDSSDSSAYQNVAASGAAGNAAGSSVSSGTYYSSQMMLLFRNIYNMDSDVALVSSINNGNHGLIAGFLGADAKINDKFSISANLGSAMNAEKQVGEDEDYIGTEVNLNLNYKLYPTLTATLQGAYVFLGDFYDKYNTTTKKYDKVAGKEMDDPYLAGLMLNYTF